MATHADRLHIVDIRFEDGRTATLTLRDDQISPEIIVSVAGLRHVKKVSSESYTIRNVKGACKCGPVAVTVERTAP